MCLVARIEKRLISWSHRWLSWAGRLVLIKSILEAILVFGCHYHGSPRVSWTWSKDVDAISFCKEQQREELFHDSDGIRLPCAKNGVDGALKICTVSLKLSQPRVVRDCCLQTTYEHRWSHRTAFTCLLWKTGFNYRIRINSMPPRCVKLYLTHSTSLNRDSLGKLVQARRSRLVVGSL